MAWTILDDHDPWREQLWPDYDTREEAAAAAKRCQDDCVEHGLGWPSLSVVDTAYLPHRYAVAAPDVCGEHVYGGGWLTPDC